MPSMWTLSFSGNDGAATGDGGEKKGRETRGGRYPTVWEAKWAEHRCGLRCEKKNVQLVWDGSVWLQLAKSQLQWARCGVVTAALSVRSQLDRGRGRALTPSNNRAAPEGGHPFPSGRTQTRNRGILALPMSPGGQSCLYGRWRTGPCIRAFPSV
jgi:hypothetical protein